MLASEETNKPKRAGLQESQSLIQVGKLTIRVRSLEISRIGQSVFIMDIKSTLMQIWKSLYMFVFI